MKFLDNLLWKPLGKGLAEADTFMRREMPFNMSWGAPAAAAAAYFGGPAVLKAIQGAGGGSMTGNSMLANYGLDAGKDFVASNGANFALPNSAYTPQYLDMLATQSGVDAGDPTLFQRFAGNTEQGLYNPKELSPNKLLAQLLKSQSKSKQRIKRDPIQEIMPQQNVAEFEDLNEPFYDQDVTQKEKNRKLLAQQLRLLRPRMAQRPQFNNTDIQSLLSNLEI